MAKLIYSAIASLDACVADREGNFDWAEPSEEVHTFINALERPIGTYLYGRRLYEVMASWETLDLEHQPGYMREFAEMWRKAEKIVYSSTLTSASTARTRVVRQFDRDVVRQMKTSANRDLMVGGPQLAASAIRERLVDEFQLFLVPRIIGGGRRFLPEDVRLSLDLVEQRRFQNGTVYLNYRPAALE